MNTSYIFLINTFDIQFWLIYFNIFFDQYILTLFLIYFNIFLLF